MTHALIADDDLDVLDLLHTLLTTAGHIVVAVSDGRQAVDQLRTMSFDLAVLDVQMPGLSGLEVLAETADLVPHRPPVMILSGLASPQDRQRGLEAGARIYLTKPFRVSDFRRAVEELVADRAQGEVPPRAALHE